MGKKPAEAVVLVAEASSTTNLQTESKTSQELAILEGAGCFEDDAGVGLENVTSKDLLIPRLTILQSLSPQLIRSKPEYMPEAHVGDICDVGTQEILPQEICVLPVHFLKQWLEWAPRASGKGLVNIHHTDGILDDCEKDEKGRQYLKNGNQIIETAQFFILNLSCEGRRSFIGMASTQLRKSRRWLTLATAEKLRRADGSDFTPPLFYRSYMLSTVEESNNEGAWCGWKIERHIALPEMERWQSLRQEALDFRDSIIAGDVKADVSSMKEQNTPASEESM